MSTKVRTRGRSLLCVIPLCGASWACMYGQGASSPSAPLSVDAPLPEQIFTSAGPYTLEWRHRFRLQFGGVPVGVSEEDGTLWLVTYTFPRKEPEDLLTKIGPNGQLIAQYDPIVPLKPKEWVERMSLAASGHHAGLLASLVSGGPDETFEGAFFLPVEPDGFGKPVRIAGEGPGFLTMAGAGGGQFIAAGEGPLTLIELDSGGKALWKRPFSVKLELPVVSVGSSGSIFVLSQGGTYVFLQMLDSSGFVVRSKRIAGVQGVVVADPGGGCSLLFSTRFGGKDNNVYLETLDPELRQLSRVEAPLIGQGERTYQLITTPRGHLVIGEGSVANPRTEVPKKVLAEFDNSGKLMWQQETTSLQPPLLAPFGSGFYVIRDLFPGQGLDVEKYVY